MNNRPTGFQCMQYTAAELIERWGKFHADITVAPLPNHKYKAEVIYDDGKIETWNFKRLSALLYFSRCTKYFVGDAKFLLVSRDGNFFTAKEV